MGDISDYSLTVLMTVHNESSYLRTGIESILQQTFGNFRFLIVDDGSTDASREIVRSYHDSRIELLCLDRNVGQTVALNIGVRHASTPWIARMDGDDYSAPTRLEEQIKALQRDPTLSCVGTYGWEFGDNPEIRTGIALRPEGDADIKRALPYTCPIIHGSIVIKREALLSVGAYDERYRYLADWEMYERLLANHRAVNIPIPLLGIRRHASQRSYTFDAINEWIEIYSRRLSQGLLSSPDRLFFQSSLTQLLISTAYTCSNKGDYLSSLGCFFKAARIAPRLLFKKGLHKCMKVVGKPFFAMVKRDPT